MTANWKISKTDEIFIEKLQDFLPNKIFDSHAHLYRVRDLNVDKGNYLDQGPKEAGFNVWKENIGRITRGADLSGGLLFPMISHDCDIDNLNAFLIEQLRSSKKSRGLMLFSPETTIDKINKYLLDPQIIGFKPYFYFSTEKPIGDASILSYFPEWAWELANTEKLIVTLHIVKSKALADPDNQDVICRMCTKYPHVKLVLAHAARGFHPQNTIEGLEALKSFDNIWFDSSAICESKSLKAVLKCFGSKKLLWGTDFPVSLIHGKCVSVGDGFVWLDNSNFDWEKNDPVCNPVFFCIESLLALKEASEDLDLTKEEISNIFYNNAQELFGIGE